ncbi:MAG: putative glycolipid-binding domain-containing protein [Moraxellaceae bacterium]|nr:putative glycolipid-binding domain-containing protein [Moraxellaceae bacterium]
MPDRSSRTFCWTPLWHARLPGAGLEHLLLQDGAADSTLLAFDEADQPFRLHYRLMWDEAWRLREADLAVTVASGTRRLALHTDGEGCWWNGDGPLPALDGCLDIDIWPTPFTNSFPIRRVPLAIGERREFRMAWVSAPALKVEPLAQAYTRLTEHRYLFESLDGSGFRVELQMDDEGIVVDYPGLFRRAPVRA